MLNQEEFFRQFGKRVKELRLKNDKTQEDMISHGFSARHWQQIEAGRSITVITALRIGETFGVKLAQLFEGLDEDAATKPEAITRPVKAKKKAAKSQKR